MFVLSTLVTSYLPYSRPRSSGPKVRVEGIDITGTPSNGVDRHGVTTVDISLLLLLIEYPIDTQNSTIYISRILSNRELTVITSNRSIMSFSLTPLNQLDEKVPVFRSIHRFGSKSGYQTQTSGPRISDNVTETLVERATKFSCYRPKRYKDFSLQNSWYVDGVGFMFLYFVSDVGCRFGVNCVVQGGVLDLGKGRGSTRSLSLIPKYEF